MTHILLIVGLVAVWVAAFWLNRKLQPFIRRVAHLLFAPRR
jgi:hypothetical protein